MGGQGNGNGSHQGGGELEQESCVEIGLIFTGQAEDDRPRTKSAIQIANSPRKKIVAMRNARLTVQNLNPILGYFMVG